MALYEYECKKCGHVFEVLTKKPTDKKEKCPKCNSLAKKLMSANSFILSEKGNVSWADKGYSNK